MSHLQVKILLLFTKRVGLCMMNYTYSYEEYIHKDYLLGFLLCVRLPSRMLNVQEYIFFTWDIRWPFFVKRHNCKTSMPINGMFTSKRGTLLSHVHMSICMDCASDLFYCFLLLKMMMMVSFSNPSLSFRPY